MAEPIYHMFMAKFTEAWHQLSDDEQTTLFAQVNQALTDVGGKYVIVCDSYWASEQWGVYGVIEFPNLDAVHKHARALQELRWSRYSEAFSLLGTKLNLDS